MRKKALAFTLILLVSFCVFAIGLEDLVQQAIENSDSMRTVELNRKNTLLSWQEDEIEDSISVTVSSGNVTVTKETGNTPIFSMGPSVDVSIPVDDDLKVNVGVSNSTRLYTSGDSQVSVSPSIEVVKSMTITSYSDTRDDITKTKNRLQQELSYQKSLIQFESSVLSDIVSILQSEENLKKARTSYQRSLTDYETDIIAGNITEGTLTDIQKKMNLDKAKVSLESQELSYSNLLAKFRRNYGIDYQAVEDVPDADLDFEASACGNTNVAIYELSLSLAQQNLEAKTGTSKSFKLGAKTGAQVTSTNGDAPNSSIEGSVYASLGAENYSVSATAATSYSSAGLIPSLTISGKWTNKTNASTSTTELEIQTLNNKVILAQIDYEDALQSYKNDANTLINSINEHYISVAQLEVTYEYDKMILEKKQQLFEAGIATERDIEDAEAAVANDEVQMLILKLKALILENDIEIINL